MSRKKNSVKIGATPGKLATVGVLAVTLAVVIYQQLPKSAPAVVGLQEQTAQQSPTETTKPKQTTQKLETKQQTAKLPEWPKAKLVETLANNPFVPPLWAANAATLPDPTELTALGKLQQQGATIVVISNGKKSATIGKNKYFVGDVLAGYRVTDITTLGLHLEKL